MKAFDGFYNRRVKRALGFVLAIPFLIVALPLYLLIAVAIVTEDGFPIFYRPLRGGYQGRAFRIFKFRTMVKNADQIGGGTTAFHDPRITKVGALLRSSNIDELPQIFNIFLGNMSFVGPRPALPKEVEQYRESDKLRLLVVPGLTCYWQATENRNQVSFDEWMELDRKYIMERSAWVDIKLIFKTFLFLFKKSGY